MTQLWHDLDSSLGLLELPQGPAQSRFKAAFELQETYTSGSNLLLYRQLSLK